MSVDTYTARLSNYEIWSHDGVNEGNGETIGDAFIMEIWAETQTDADKIAEAFQKATGKFMVRAYYQFTGVCRPE